MLAIEVQRYTPDLADDWNDFITHSINGTFLFDRGFMDYHADRFTDHSIIFSNDSGWVCCMPATINNSVLNSHSGLTYGGFIFKSEPDNSLVDQVLETLIGYLRKYYINLATVKLQPGIYCSFHDLLICSMETAGFSGSGILQNMHFALSEKEKISSKKTAGYRNGKFENLRFQWLDNLSKFYDIILTPSLKARHDAQPVHSLAELELLKSRFPNKIRLAAVYEENKMLAGVLFFLKDNIAKSQYAAATPVGMKKKAMDFLYLESYKLFEREGVEVLDFGTVNNPDGSINQGLKRFKKELGAIVEDQLTFEYHAG